MNNTIAIKGSLSGIYKILHAYFLFFAFIIVHIFKPQPGFFSKNYFFEGFFTLIILLMLLVALVILNGKKLENDQTLTWEILLKKTRAQLAVIIVTTVVYLTVSKVCMTMIGQTIAKPLSFIFEPDMFVLFYCLTFLFPNYEHNGKTFLASSKQALNETNKIAGVIFSFISLNGILLWVLSYLLPFEAKHIADMVYFILSFWMILIKQEERGQVSRRP